MSKKKQLVEDQASDNLASVAAKPNKANAMAQAVTMLASMSGDDITRLVDVLKQNSASAAAAIPDDAAAKNAATVAMKEELEVIFGGEDLAEEFKEKISTLFEAAVATRSNLMLAEAEQQFESALNEQTEVIIEQMTDQIDKYLSYMAGQWMIENEVAIESSIKTEIAEQFIEGLKELFKEHYIDIPDDRIDVVETYEDKVAELEEQLNDVMNRNIELEEAMVLYNMEEVFEDVADGLPLTQVEKFRSLAEGIEYTGDLDTYKRKLNIIKENHFKSDKKPSVKSNILEESFDSSEDKEEKVVSPQVERYMQSISRSVKK